VRTALAYVAAIALAAGAWAAHAHPLRQHHADIQQRLAETEHRLAETARLLADAERDVVTGLPTRGPWLRAARDAYCALSDATVLFVDLDHFKAVNDDLGHQTGDEVLAAAAVAMATVLGVADGAAVVGRVGGDEYAAVVAGIRPGSDGEAQLAHLHAMVADALADACSHPALGASLGAVQTVAPERPELDDTLRGADKLMYLAKRTDADLAVLAAAA
jgi:diguanylate cyclase (GGDEF)-like protein